MSRATPEQTFAEAQVAITRGDWDGFLVCLDTKDLMRIAANSVKYLLWIGQADAEEFCTEHGIANTFLLTLRTLFQRMEESARSYQQADTSSPEAMLRHSLLHKQIVDEYRKSEKAILKAAADLPRLTAALEKRLRATINGGSISSTMFIDEDLVDISIAGTKAYATRRTANGYSEDVGFVQRKGKWYIRLFAKRPHHETGEQNVPADCQLKSLQD